MADKKKALANPKAFLTTKMWEDEEGHGFNISVAIREGYYKNLNEARGVILEDFNLCNKHYNCVIYLGKEIESEDCIEMPVYLSQMPVDQYAYSYYITKVY